MSQHWPVGSRQLDDPDVEPIHSHLHRGWRALLIAVLKSQYRARGLQPRRDSSLQIHV